MKRTAQIFVLLAFAMVGIGICNWATAGQKVKYVSDSILEKNDNFIGLLGGSSWLLSRHSISLVTDELFIVFESFVTRNKKKVQIPIAYIKGEEIPVKHIDGSYFAQTGYLTRVIQAVGDGALLKLEDGTLLAVPEYDRYDTGWWLPPYKALLTENGLYLWNLKEGKRIWVNKR